LFELTLRYIIVDATVFEYMYVTILVVYETGDGAIYELDNKVTPANNWVVTPFATEYPLTVI
jgi:hypothetical protein